MPELAEKIGVDDFGVQAATLASSLTESQQREYFEDYGEEELSVASVRAYTRGISCKLAEAKIEGEIKRRMEKLREMGFDENGKRLEND